MVDVLTVLRNVLVPVVQTLRFELKSQFAWFVVLSDLADRLDLVWVCHQFFNNWIVNTLLFLS